MKVIKRDNREVKFDTKRIKKAIQLANDSVEEQHRLSKEKIDKVMDFIKDKIKSTKQKTLSVEQIQDIVENALMNKNCYEVAKSYVLFRAKRTKDRSRKSEFRKILKEKLLASNVANQNANVDEYSFGGRKGEADSELMKKLALEECMSDMAVRNHENNEIYVHDLDSYFLANHNCLSIPFDDLLKNGFNTRQADIRPAGSVNTACQLLAVIFQVQSLQQFGGVSATHLDYTLVPYLRKSFVKHYKDGLKYLKRLSNEKIDKKLEKLVSNCTNLTNDITKLDLTHKKLKKNKRIYDFALDLTVKELRQALEAFFHHAVSLCSRSGNQLPFTSINYGTDSSFEGRLVNREIIRATLNGIGKNNRTAIFPCGIFVYDKNINGMPYSPNYDLYQYAITSTVRRFYPNYANNQWSVQQQGLEKDRKLKQKIIDSLSEDDHIKLWNFLCNPMNSDIRDRLDIDCPDKEVYLGKDSIKVHKNANPSSQMSTMGCRTYNGFDINFGEIYRENIESVLENSTLKYPDFLSAMQKDGRGNIIPTTIILPTLAMQTFKKHGKKSKKELIEEFMKLLDKKISEARDMLLERYSRVISQPESSAKFMWENGLMKGYIPEQGIESAMKHGTLAIGQLGLAECLQILVGCNHTKKEGMNLAIKIEELFKKRCNEYKEQYKLNFGVYYTPAENLCYTAMKKFQKKYGTIPNVSDHEFFTNSIHVPVWEKISPFDKIDIESKLTGYSSAGCITYVEVNDEANNNPEAIQQIIDYAMAKDIPYFAINISRDECFDCGYSGTIEDKCPVCESSNIYRPRRVTGYLTGDYKKAFNKGKQQETELREKHTDKNLK